MEKTMGFIGTLIASYIGYNLAKPARNNYDETHVLNEMQRQRKYTKINQEEDKFISEIHYDKHGHPYIVKTNVKVGENGTKMITDI